MLPLISASNGSIIFFCLVFFSGNLRRAAAATGLPKFSMLWFVPWLMLRDQKRENRGQQHKNQRLHDPHQYLHEIKRNRNQPGKRGHHGRHRFQNAFACVNVSKKPKAERDRAEQNRNDLEPAYHEKDHDHHNLQKTRRLTFRAEKMKQKSADAICLDRPYNPEQEKNKNENRREEPKRFFHQIAADNALKKIVKTFHQPFPKVLRTARNRLDLSCR